MLSDSTKLSCQTIEGKEMKTVETPPMPRFKLFFYLTLFSIALLLFVLLMWYGELDPQRMLAIVVGVMIAFFITSSTELIPEAARRLGEISQRGKFKRFFGETAFNRSPRLVFAHRRLDSSLFETSPWKTHYEAPNNTYAEGVNVWLAFQDIRAATYLSNAFYKMTGNGVKLIHDKEIEGDAFNYCAISIGLGFNGFTHWLSEQCDKKLFEIVFGKSPKDPDFETDLYKIGEEFPEIPANKDDCIVARIVLKPYEGNTNRVCFVCAGRTASGTAAAGYFLAKEWMQLMRLYDDDKKKSLDLDSLVVVVRHNHDPFGRHHFDTSGVIVTELTHWHRISAFPKE
jgi:hypothetical protein